MSCVPLPAHTVHLPHWLNLTLCAPPLLRVQREGQAGEEEEGKKEGLTDSKPRDVWRAVRPTFDGWARLARAEPLLVSWRQASAGHAFVARCRQGRTMPARRCRRPASGALLPEAHISHHLSPPFARRLCQSGEAGRGTSISNSSADLSYGDGIHFPKLSQTWGWGLHVSHESSQLCSRPPLSFSPFFSPSFDATIGAERAGWCESKLRCVDLRLAKADFLHPFEPLPFPFPPLLLLLLSLPAYIGP